MRASERLGSVVREDARRSDRGSATPPPNRQQACVVRRNFTRPRWVATSGQSTGRPAPKDASTQLTDSSMDRSLLGRDRPPIDEWWLGWIRAYAITRNDVRTRASVCRHRFASLLTFLFLPPYPTPHREGMTGRMSVLMRQQQPRQRRWLPLLLLLLPAAVLGFVPSPPAAAAGARSAALAAAAAGTQQRRSALVAAAAAAAVMEKDSRATKAAFERLFVKIAKAEAPGQVGLVVRRVGARVGVFELS